MLTAARCCAAIVGRALDDFFSIERLGSAWVSGSPVPTTGPPIVVPSPLVAHHALHLPYRRVRVGKQASSPACAYLLLQRPVLASSGVLVTKFSPATGASLPCAVWR